MQFSETSADCITKIKLVAKTGRRKGAGFKRANKHQFALRLKNGKLIKGDIKGPARKNRKKKVVFNLPQNFLPYQRCVKMSDISEVLLVAAAYDGWYIKRITTYTKVGQGGYKVLTKDRKLNKRLGKKKYAYNTITLLLVSPPTVIIEPVPCGFDTPVCECKLKAKVCIFNLEVDEIRTFTSYPKRAVGGKGEGLFVRDQQGAMHHITKDGKQEPLEQYKETPCGDNFDSATCSDPMFVDGKTYRMGIAVNGQIPGPTLIVHENQKVVIHVHNNLTSEGISIHWHGIHQKETPWMDGVGQVTQCHIGPSSSYSYMYIASPSGTFWYHSHSGAQRTDGLFGAMIVKERPGRLKEINRKLGMNGFEDHPTKHTLTLLDWQHEASLDLFTQLNDGLGFYPGVPIGEVPPSDKNRKYGVTFSMEGGAVGPVPYFSGLINGKGRHSDVPYDKTRLSIFTVERGHSYRFRLIGAQGLYAYKFSIDGHKLTVVNTDGYWIKPEKQVDYIIIHTGERYDFILEANANSGDYYWIRAETLEVDRNSNGGKPPFKSLNHVAEAILQYTKAGQAQQLKSTEYECIKKNSKPPNCSKHKCRAINCPFKAFHPSYNIDCINVHQLKLLEPTPSNEMPQAYPSKGCNKCLYFMNFNFEGSISGGSVNGRNFILPPVPPQTQHDDFLKQAKICSLTSDCNPAGRDCICTHTIDIPYKKTVQFVWTSIGGNPEAHPIHLHGHTFHVVHIGYPEYNSTTGFISREREKHSKDIQCNDCQGKPEESKCDRKLCTKPSWKNNKSPSFSIDSHTIRKDTVMIPAGGYVVVNFLSDNPGYWFLHCHIEYHQLEGMAILVNEAFEQQKSLGAPKGSNKCGNVDLSGGAYKPLTSSNIVAVKGD